MTGGELFQEMAVDACGEAVTEDTEAIYDQQIRGQMDVAQMAFVTGNGDSVEVFGYYRLEGSKLKFYYPAMGILDHLCLEPEQYMISFSGRNPEKRCWIVFCRCMTRKWLRSMGTGLIQSI